MLLRDTSKAAVIFDSAFNLIRETREGRNHDQAHLLAVASEFPKTLGIRIEHEATGRNI